MKIIFFLLLLTLEIYAQRETISLNGLWLIEQSVDSAAMPKTFEHKIDVPGLVRTAEPPFEKVDQFVSFDYNKYEANPDRGKYSIDDPKMIGISLQKRNYFWYKRNFKFGKKKEVIILKVNKAQFGSAVWINGSYVGRNLSNCTSACYNISDLIKFDDENEIVIRIGAHPGVLPYWMYSGKDDDKRYWTPGIWDDVSIIACDNPYIESIQIAPDINNSRITIQTVISNFKNKSIFDLNYILKEWKSGKEIASLNKSRIKISPNGKTVITETINVPNQHLWSPDDPFLYSIKVKTSGDNSTVRFGMRELRFNSKTRKAYLNNKIFYMRGSNIALHRFFDDTLCTKQPWDTAWVKKFLIEIPKEFNWNTFRTHVGLVPEYWLDLADENGILIQYEMQNWGTQPYWDTSTFEKVVKDWMKDSWNHPSVVIWDICNEYRGDETGEIIKKVRHLDLSNRPWDNGYNLPVDENDPIEDHHYLKFFTKRGEIAPWEMEFYEQTVAPNGTRNVPFPTNHATILNEYGWFFTRRDGSAGAASKQQFELLCPNCSNQQIREFSAYMYAGETEYFRAHRNYCGILHFVYLTGDYKGSATGDIFKDVNNLMVDSSFYKYLKEAFKPIGVYLNFWQQTLKPGTQYKFAVMIINDEYIPNEGELKIKIINEENKTITEIENPYKVYDLSEKTYFFDISFPKEPGNYKLLAEAKRFDNKKTTTSTRIFKIK